MNFILTPIYDQPNNTSKPDTKESSPKENEHNDDYNDMITPIKQPITTSVDKQRLNEIVVCPQCNKPMTNNTFTYSHNCQTIKALTSIEATEKQITDEDVHAYLQKQGLVSRDNLISQRKGTFNNMMKRAF